MVKIYTKTGDRGTTSLLGGQRVPKNSRRIRAYGYVDELNSLLGLLFAERLPTDIKKKIHRIQSELFTLGSNLAASTDVGLKIPNITKTHVTRLEKEIDDWSEKLPMLKNFILPGGSKEMIYIHLEMDLSLRNFLVHSDHKKNTKNEPQKNYYQVIRWDKERTGAQLHRARTLARGVERELIPLYEKGLLRPNAFVYINRLSDWLFVLARYVNMLEGIEEKVWLGRRTEKKKL